jgi:soluble lytic murein transglycosylase-like protein
VESSRREKAVGDNGKAVGLLQLHKVYVDDVNRIVGKKKYSYADRWNPQKSIEMTVIYLKHYGRRYERITGKTATYEVLARIHNGGPDGWEKTKTREYWCKVQKHL